MTDLLALSADIIDGRSDGPTSRVSLECSPVTDNISVVESFSNIVTVSTGDGLVVFDTTLITFAHQALAALRTWSNDPLHTVVYTHGHVDHVTGTPVFLAEADARGDKPADIVAHEAVPDRFHRYQLTQGYNAHINARQFGGTGLTGLGSDDPPLFPNTFVEPTTTYADELTLEVGGTPVVLHHDRGETDDHTWAWLEGERALVVGDLFIWCFPNAGNPAKVQRYPADWAAALRRMIDLEPELLLPAHGLPVAGADRIATVLGDVAGSLEFLMAETLAAMNAGATLDAIIAGVHLDPAELEKPWLAPVYDEPEFVIRNIWRQYGGWYDGTPSRLKPATDAAQGSEWVRLAGGTPTVVARAEELASAGDDASLRLACHLIDAACAADPTDPGAAAAAAGIYSARRDAATSLMAKGIYGTAANTAKRIAASEATGEGRP